MRWGGTSDDKMAARGRKRLSKQRLLPSLESREILIASLRSFQTAAGKLRLISQSPAGQERDYGRADGEGIFIFDVRVLLFVGVCLAREKTCLSLVPEIELLGCAHCQPLNLTARFQCLLMSCLSIWPVRIESKAAATGEGSEFVANCGLLGPFLESRAPFRGIIIIIVVPRTEQNHTRALLARRNPQV